MKSFEVESETLYVVPKSQPKRRCLGSMLNKEAYINAKNKKETTEARTLIFEEWSIPGCIYRKFEPPKDFSKGSIKKLDPNTIEIKYGDETIYRITSKDYRESRVYTRLKDSGKVVSICKKIDKKYRTRKHLDKLAFDDYCKLRDYVLRKHRLVSDCIPFMEDAA